jgi:hypothetical protein
MDATVQELLVMRDKRNNEVKELNKQKEALEEKVCMDVCSFLSACICVYTRTYACIKWKNATNQRLYMCICMYTHTYIHICICSAFSTNMYLHTCIHTYISVCVSSVPLSQLTKRPRDKNVIACMHVCMCACTPVCALQVTFLVCVRACTPMCVLQITFLVCMCAFTFVCAPNSISRMYVRMYSCVCVQVTFLICLCSRR